MLLHKLAGLVMRQELEGATTFGTEAHCHCYALNLQKDTPNTEYAKKDTQNIE